MQVFIDGDPFPIDLKSEPSVQSVVDALRIHTLTRRRVITSISLDAVAVLVQEEKAIFGTPAAAHEKLEIATADPKALALSVIAPLLPFLDQLEGAHELAAETLHAGKMREFAELMLQCVQGWELLISGVRNLGALLGTVEAAQPDDLGRNVAQLATAVSTLKTAFQNQDPSRLGDVMEYDLAERIPYWRGLLKKMRDALNA